MPSLVGGGAERTLINFLNRVDFNLYEVHLAVVSFKGIYIKEVPAEVKVIPLFKNDLLVRIAAYTQKKIGIISLFRSRMRRKVTSSYDVGISFLDGNFTELLFFNKQIKNRVAFIHGSYKSNDFFYRFFKHEKYRRRVKRERYDKLDFLVFVSEDSKKEFEELFGTYSNSKVIYNVIGVDMIKEKAEAFLPKRSSHFLFFAMGSLLKVKGFDRLIRASKIIKEKGADFQIQIAGKGPEEPELQNLIDRLGLQEEVKLIGFQENPYPIMQNADAFVLSSVSEALPTVVCEAMILGKPIIATDCSGARSLLGDSEYGLIAAQDDQDLATKMFSFITQKELRENFSKKSLQRRESFDDEAIMRQYYKILNGNFV